MNDAWTKGRNTFQTNGNPSQKLSDKQIAEIRRRRANGELLRVIAAEFGVSMGHVCAVSELMETNGRVGSRHFRAKLKEYDIKTIRALRLEGLTYAEIGRRFGVASSAVSKVVRGLAWKHVVES